MPRYVIRSKDPDIRGSYKALLRAAKKALELGLQTGTPVWVVKNGVLVDLTKEYPHCQKAKPAPSKTSKPRAKPEPKARQSKTNRRRSKS